MRKCVIFDLDGTLTQSEEGIWNCVKYAAEKLGFPVPDGPTLRKFIGPPLGYSPGFPPLSSQQFAVMGSG